MTDNWTPNNRKFQQRKQKKTPTMLMRDQIDILRGENEQLQAALQDIERNTGPTMLATNHGRRGDIANAIARHALNDIVERLHGNYDDGIKRKPSAIKLEAAAEIKRLRQRITTLEGMLGEMDIAAPEWTSALEPKL